MRYWVFWIDDQAGGPDLGVGWIRAESAERALALVPHPDVNIVPVPDDSGFPAEATGAIHWDLRAPSLTN